MRKTIITFFFLIVNLGHHLVIASPAENPEMADTLMRSGKIYVVLGVLLIIFTGIIIFLITLEKRIKKLEKNK